MRSEEGLAMLKDLRVKNASFFAFQVFPVPIPSAFLFDIITNIYIWGWTESISCSLSSVWPGAWHQIAPVTLPAAVGFGAVLQIYNSPPVLRGDAEEEHITSRYNNEETGIMVSVSLLRTFGVTRTDAEWISHSKWSKIQLSGFWILN